MAQFLITYDNHPPRNYASLYDLMKAWQAVRLADSVWLANLRGPADAVRDLVQKRLQWNDSIAVIELKPGSDWATSHIKPSANNWLSAFVTRSQRAA